MKAQWQSEKQAIRGISELKEQLEQARIDAERAQRDADLERASNGGGREGSKPGKPTIGGTSGPTRGSFPRPRSRNEVQAPCRRGGNSPVRGARLQGGAADVLRCAWLWMGERTARWRSHRLDMGPCLAGVLRDPWGRCKSGFRPWVVSLSS